MSKHGKRRAHRRIILFSLLGIALGAMLAPLSGYLYVGIAGAQEQAADPVVQNSENWDEVNPRSEYWRDVRRGVAGYSTDKTRAGNVLILGSGENWRRVRNGFVATYGGWFMALMVLALGLFYILRGAIKLEQEPSGRTITRWRRDERILHWSVAVLFIIMAITGLSILFGRAVLIPLFGQAGFAVWAGFSKLLHNYTGVLFTVSIILLIVAWIRDNMPRREDLAWLRNGGGMFGKHAPAGRMNAGEKLWFWFIASAGLVVCASGLVLDFPNFFTERTTMQAANIIHAVLAIGWIGFFLGHVYIGTLGTDGALEGMTTGDVSVEWAQQHHELWYEEVTSGKQEDSKAGAAAKPSAPDSA